MQVWEAKGPGEVKRYRYVPSLERDESITSATVNIDSGTVTATSEIETDQGKEGVTVLVTGGAAGETARVSIDIVTSDGRTVVPVLYVPVRAEAPVLGNTANDVVAFGLRKIVGNGETATADEAADALERLNAMLMLWRIDGLDVGVADELTLVDTVTVKDEHLTAIKWCLRADLHDFYGEQLTTSDVRMAESAKAAVRNDLLDLKDLHFDRGLLRQAGSWDYTRGY